MTYRTMIDSTTAKDVQPTDVPIVAGYIDGNYDTFDELRTLVPHARHVSITIHGGAAAALVCDTEPGNVGIAGACKWAAERVNAGHYATLYCMQSQWSTVRSELRKHLGWPKRRKVAYWVAQYDGVAKIPLTWRRLRCVAKQYASSDVPAGQAGHTSGHRDVSVVLGYWPGLDPIGLSAWRIRQVRRVAGWLRHRQVPVGHGRDALHDLEVQVHRVLGMSRDVPR